MEKVQLNIAYRWFCGFELDDTIPNHSTFSKTRTRKWQQSDLFQKAFYEIVKQCIDSGLIDGEAMAADGSYIPANVSRESWINVEIEVEQSMQSYLDSEDGKCHLSLFPNLLFCWNLCGFQQFFAFVNRSLIVHYRRIHRCWGHGRRKQCRPRRAAGMWRFARQGSESAQENTLRAPSRSNRPVRVIILTRTGRLTFACGWLRLVNHASVKQRRDAVWRNDMTSCSTDSWASAAGR